MCGRNLWTHWTARVRCVLVVMCGSGIFVAFVVWRVVLTNRKKPAASFHYYTVCFLALHLITSISMWAFKMSFDLKSYTRQTWSAYLLTNFQQCALSFMLFWTLFYGLVYLYD